MPSEYGEDSATPSPPLDDRKSHTESQVALCDLSSGGSSFPGPSRQSRKKEVRPCVDEAEKMISFLVGKMKGQYIKKGLTQEAENLNMRGRYKNLEKEILSVCRRINRVKSSFDKSSKSLLDVFSKEDDSVCLLIKRNRDGRIQVDGRKVWPHAFMHHLYRTFIKGETSRSYCGSHSELRTNENLETPCQFPFTNDQNDDQKHLCINPFHYQEKLKIDVNRYVKKSETSSPKVLQWQNEESDHGKRIQATLTSTKSSKKKNKDKSNDAVIIDNELISELADPSKRHWQKPLPPDNFSIENANKIINYRETVSKAYEKRSLHNTRSRSPRESRRGVPSEPDEQFIVEEIKSQLEGVELSSSESLQNGHQFAVPHGIISQGAQVKVDKTQQESEEVVLDQVLQVYQPHPQNIEQIYTVNESILLVDDEENPWCQVQFYECNKKVDFYSSNKRHVDIFYPSECETSNRYKKSDQRTLRGPDQDIIDLSSIPNVNRSPETWDLLEKLDKGITLIYDRDRKIVSCHNKCKSLKVYVLSYLMNVECGKHEQSLIQVSPGATRVVYDGWQLARTIDGINSQTNNDLEKWVLVGNYAKYFTVFRISFQPWGPNFATKRLTDCDVWLEIQMREYLDWIRKLENHYEYVLHDSRFNQPETTPQDEDFTPLPEFSTFQLVN